MVKILAHGQNFVPNLYMLISNNLSSDVICWLQCSDDVTTTSSGNLWI